MSAPKHDIKRTGSASSAKAPDKATIGNPGRHAYANEKIEKGTWARLIRYCKRYLLGLLIAVVCAAGASVITLVGPHKIGDITDLIVAGITPDQEMIKTIGEDIGDNIQKAKQEAAEKAARAQAEARARMLAAQRAQQGQALQGGLPYGVAPDDTSLGTTSMSSSPSATTEASPVSSTPVITPKDQPTDEDTSLDNPESIDKIIEAVEVGQITLGTIAIDDVEINQDDQIAYLKIAKDLDTSDQDAALAAFDKLPQSIKSLIEPKIDLDAVFKIAWFLAVLYLIGTLLSAIEGIVMANITQRIVQKLRFDLSRKANKLPMKYFHAHTTGDTLSRVTNDTDMLGMELNATISTLVAAATLFFGSLIMMFVTNVTMAIAGVLSTIIGFVIMAVIMSLSQKFFTHQQNALGALNGYVEEMYSGHTIVQAYNGTAKAKKDFGVLNDDLKNSGYKSQALSGLMMPIMTFIGNLGYVVVCVTGAALALDGQIEFGVIVSFIMYIRLFTQPLSQFAQGAQALQTVGAAASRIFSFLGEQELPDESNKPLVEGPVKGQVDFEHVRFGYEPDKTIIHDFTTHVKPGQKIAIVGPTGAGKTTLMSLLMRFYEIDSGSIKIDGTSTQDMRRSQVHDDFCMVLQDAWIFEGTLRQNLIYCTKGATDEIMRDACNKVGLDYFVQTLPQGYDTVLNDQISLSQGQRQQVTIARAIIANKPMLILDEATSSLDTRTELKIQEAMDHLMKDRTSFVIAHRLSTIRDADLILVIRDGDIVETGTHEGLLSQNGFYAELYNSQFTQTS